MQDFIEENTTQSAIQEVPGFNRFIKEHSNFYANTRERVEWLWKLYKYTQKKQTKKIVKDACLYNKFQICAYSILMRQSLEFIADNESFVAFDIITEETLDDQLDILKKTRAYDQSSINTLYTIKQLTNKASHTSYFDEDDICADEYINAYQNGYRQFLNAYIANNKRIKNIKYLKKIQNSFENITCKDKTLRALLIGLFMRLITESIASVLCFRRKLIETAEDGKTLSIFEMLNRVAKFEEEKGSTKNEQIFRKINYLHEFRITSNLAMHYTQNIDDIQGCNRIWQTDVGFTNLYCKGLQAIFDKCDQRFSNICVHFLNLDDT